jgi:tripartite-type tricarboxylate transporter receptor subunit TctC
VTNSLLSPALRLRRRRAILTVAFAALLAVCWEARADNYPVRPIHLIVPVPPGGAVDIVARLLQPHLEKALGQPVIVENRSGASGAIGADAVAKAAPDGHTLLMAPSTFAVNAAVNPKLPYDAQRDFQPIAVVGKNSLLFLVNPTLPAHNLSEFVALARKEAGKLNYATPGAASQAHLLIEMWSARAGIKMQHIPYRGGAPAVMATVTGETHFTVMTPIAVAAQLEAKTLRPIANASPARDANFPELPTVAESGFPGFETVQWIGLFTTAGVPASTVQRLNKEVNAALLNKDLQSKLAIQGVARAGGSAEDFTTLLATDIRNWRETAQKAHISAQ